MWSAHIYRALYLFFYYSYTIFENICDVVEYVIIKIVDFCHEFLPAAEKTKRIQSKLDRISKIPTHVTVLLGHEEVCYKDLANLVIWCLATRISFISFYDYKGFLKKNECELQHEINQRKRKEDHVIWHSESESTYKNGFSGRRIHVKILTEEDGRNSVVNVTKDIALSSNRDFSIENISHCLSKKFEFPDPDLGLHCGKTFSFYGYPPWQVRVTEFFRIKYLRNITFSAFLDLLVMYSRCEQRLGK